MLDGLPIGTIVIREDGLVTKTRMKVIGPGQPNKAIDADGAIGPEIVRIERHESRGLHYSRDYPETLAEARDTVLVPGAEGAWRGSRAPAAATSRA